MAVYVYKAKKGPEEVIHGEIEAVSTEEAVEKITGSGLVPINIFEKKSPGETIGSSGPDPDTPEPGTRLLFCNIRSSDVDTFTRQLSSLIRAGVPVLKAVDLISRQTENKALSKAVAEIGKKIRTGKMLSDAMKEYPRIFDNLYLSMIRAGEKSGTLDSVLEKLAEYGEKQNETRHKVRTAMAYPIFMMVAGICTVFLILTYFLPRLTGLFITMDRALPLPTRILMGISGFFSDNAWFILAAVVCLALFLVRVSPGSRKKVFYDALKLRVPLLRDITRKSEIARFTGTLGLLFGHGIPVYEALTFASDTMTNEVLKKKLSRVSGAIVGEGTTLSAGLERAGVLPAFALNMIAVGEESGDLEGPLTEVASTYEKEVDRAIKVWSSLLEPMLILIIGGVVAFIVFAMLLPIFDIAPAP
ncbi:MAG: type II secretion system F family protein [Candidatus Omnitrophota bacterium]